MVQVHAAIYAPNTREQFMKLSYVALTVLLSAFTAFGVMKFAAPTATAEKKETAFKRVMRTGTLNCGYIVMPPQLIRDPNTGTFSGVAFDIMTEAAKRLNLSLKWKEEVSFQTVAEGLKTGRYDSFCFTSYRWSPAARVMEYTQPLYFSTTNIYTHIDDTRFDSDTQNINTAETKIATIDGEASTFIQKTDYPKASVISLPQSTDFSLLLETVATRKADLTFSNPLMVMPYLAANPNKVKRIDGTKPLRTYAHAFAFQKGEHNLTSMFNLVLQNMLDDGTVDTILDTHEVIPNSFVRVAKSFNNEAGDKE